MTSVFRDILNFFNHIGVYDVVLPFLLVFTIVFAIFEKTKVLGTDKIDGTNYSKKNLNSLVAFCIGFFVIASSRLVEIIWEVSSNMVILLLLSVFFLLLIGSFYKEGDDAFALNNTWKAVFTGIMFIGISAIFLHAIQMEDGTPFLNWFISYVYNNLTSTLVGSIILMAILIGFMYLVVSDPKKKVEGEKSKS
jgi:hypothetical protein